MSTTLPRLALALTALALLTAGLAGLPAASGARDTDDDEPRTRSDRNGDRIPDRWERRHHLSLRVNQARRDQDKDGLHNRQEFLAGTSPRDRDSDDDGLGDAREGAGRIVSFTDGVLTIEPFGTADALRGRVDANTELECEKRDDGAKRARTSDSGGGDDHGGHGSRDDEDTGGPQSRDDDDRSRRDDDDDDACAVSSARLVAGAIVHEAELEVRSGGAFWEEVELVDS